MQPVQRGEILGLTEYEAVREQTRAEVLRAKEPRRIALGPNMTVLFENRDTVRYQIQEMLRIERTTGEKEIAHELETYNELVPGDGELTATLLIEYETPEERDRQLTALLGLEKGALRLVVGGREIPAAFDQRQVNTRRISSVHYLRFGLGAAREAFEREGLQGNVRLVVDHPAYRAQAVLLPPQVKALAQDLATD